MNNHLTVVDEYGDPIPPKLRRIVSITAATYTELHVLAMAENTGVDNFVESLLKESLVNRKRATWPPAVEQRSD
jgi:hypothetical protein